MCNQKPDFESFEPEDENRLTTPGLPPLNNEDETDDELLTEIFGELASPSLTATTIDDLEEDEYLPSVSAKPRRPTLASQAARVVQQWGERATGTVAPRHSSTIRQDTWSAALTEEIELMEQMAATAVATKNQTEAVTLAAALPVLAIRLSPQSYRALWPALPALMQGVMGLTRFLYGRAETRPLIRQIPAILENTIADLAERVANGRQVTPVITARTLARQTGLCIQQQQRSGSRLQKAPQRPKQQRNDHGYAG